MEPLQGLEFGPIEADTLTELRLLNDTTFPVRYNEKFYAEVLTTRPEYTKYAYWKGRVVGAICCRLEDHIVTGQQRLYIMTLGVQAAYRGRGVGSRLLQSVLEAARRVNTAAVAAPPQQGQQGAAGDGNNNDVAAAAAPPVAEVYLHVQTSNADALAFYKKFAFENRGIIRNYYKRIEPPDCYMLALPLLEGMEHLQQPQPAAAVSARAPGALVA